MVKVTSSAKQTSRGEPEQAPTRGVEFPRPYVIEFNETTTGLSDLDDHEVVVAARYSVVSPGTELARYRGETFGSRNHGGFPFRPGYAMAGVVVRAGSEAGVEEGAEVLSYTPHQSVYRFDRRKVICVAIPRGLALGVAPFGRLAQVGAVALQVSAAKPDDVVVVVGLGPIGNLAAQLAAASGYRVVGVEKSDYRRRVARACGLQRVVDPSAARAELDSLGGARLVLECSGSTAALLLAADLCSSYGEILAVGAPWKAEADVAASAIVGRIFESYLTLRSGWEWQLPKYDERTGRSVEASLEWVLRKLEDGSIVTDPLVSGTLKPEDAARGYQLLDANPEENLTFLLNWGE